MSENPTKTRDPILKVNHVNKYFGALHAANDVTFEVPNGQLRAFIGPNGAGKSTLMDLICNRTTLTDGQILFRGEDITKLPPYEIVRKGMCKCFQITQIFSSLTVFENVQIARINMNKKGFSFKAVRNNFLKDEALKFLAMVGLEDKVDEVAGFLSYGDQRRLDIAIALAMEPTFLILDEPAAGVAREEAYRLMDLIRKLAVDKDMTMLFIEHDMEIVFNYADEISVMSNGALIATDTPENIRHNDFVQKAYLGGES